MIKVYVRVIKVVINSMIKVYGKPWMKAAPAALVTQNFKSSSMVERSSVGLRTYHVPPPLSRSPYSLQLFSKSGVVVWEEGVALQEMEEE